MTDLQKIQDQLEKAMNELKELNVEDVELAHDYVEYANILVKKLTIPDVVQQSEQYCLCISRTGISGEQYGKHTCNSCGKEVPNKHRQY